MTTSDQLNAYFEILGDFSLTQILEREFNKSITNALFIEYFNRLAAAAGTTASQEFDAFAATFKSTTISPSVLHEGPLESEAEAIRLAKYNTLIDAMIADFKMQLGL